MKQTFLKSAAAALAVCALGLAAGISPASAGILTYDFTIDNCSSGCGASNYGTVTLTDILGGGVTVNVSLLNGAGLIDTGALSKHSLLFNLVGNPAITLTGLPSLWTYTGPTSITPGGGFGTFNYIVDCNAACDASTPWTAPLNFSITTPSITTTSFIDGGTDVDAYFVADISNVAAGGSTGRIGASYVGTPSTHVPEPITMSVFAAGLAGAAALRRRKLRTA